MNDDISFGDFREARPKSGLAPLQNPHLETAWVGGPASGMPVFVDIDTMRELELHALSNIDVELGGVMLGERCVDREGNPFVVVHDSLRAEHYEATRGSFKFTHETWQAITRRREAFPEHLEMVGWYHTHPDWSVFLSSMDLFICDHFFNGPLDIALVIDPIRDDRGWFIWSGEDAKSIQRTPGFYLFAHRGRSQELRLVAESYNEVISMQADPRFRSVSSATAGATPAVHLHERPMGAWFWAMGLLAAVQLLLMTWIVVRSAAPPVEYNRLEARLTALGQQRAAEQQAESYRELLIALAEKSPGDQGLVDRWTIASESNSQLRAALEGYAALAEKLRSDHAVTSDKLSGAEQASRQLSEKLAKQTAEVESLRQTVADAKSRSAAGKPVGTATWPPWVYWTASGVALLGIGAGGFFIGRRSALERWGASGLGD